MKFHTVEQALKWAYEERTKPIIAASSLGKEPGPPCSNELDQTERHMMAEDILKRTLKTLDMHEWAFVCFMFSDSHNHWARTVLVAWLMSSDLPLHSRAAELLLQGYRGDKKIGGIRELRTSLRMGMLRVAALRIGVYDHLDNLYVRSIEKLWAPLSGYLK